jgi:ADP-heptose:LPS heptosyltransferase
MKFNVDCIYYIGEKPCRFKRLCEGCPEYRPMGKRILIIKLAAIGDVLRTTALIPGLVRRYRDPHITWVTDRAAAQLIRTTDGIGRLMTYDLGTVLALMSQRFDVLISLDKEPRAIGLAELVRAERKLGFGMSPEGSLTTFNPESEYALRLGLDDPLKFHENKKSYPEIIYEMCAIPYEGDRYVVGLDPDKRRWAERLFAERGLTKKRPLVGLNTGAGPAFTHKAWTADGFAGLARALVEKTGGTVLLLGGEREAERNREIEAAAGGAALAVGGDQSLSEFAAMISLLDLLVTGDTMALHLGVGLSVPTVAIFGPTAHAEVDLFGLGEKVVTTIDCAPCYRGRCDKNPNCMDKIGTDEVLSAALLVLKKNPRRDG